MNEWERRWAEFEAHKYRCVCRRRFKTAQVHCRSCGRHFAHRSGRDPDVTRPCPHCKEVQPSGRAMVTVEDPR